MNIVLSSLCSIFSVLPRLPVSSDVKSSRPKWPRGQNFGLSLGLEHLASDCPRSRCLIVVRMHPSDYSIETFTVWLLCIRAFSGKIRVKFGNFGNFTGNNLKSYVVNHYLVLFHIFLALAVSLGLNLQKASASASRFWPRLTSLRASIIFYHPSVLILFRPIHFQVQRRHAVPTPSLASPVRSAQSLTHGLVYTNRFITWLPNTYSYIAVCRSWTLWYCACREEATPQRPNYRTLGCRPRYRRAAAVLDESSTAVLRRTGSSSSRRREHLRRRRRWTAATGGDQHR